MATLPPRSTGQVVVVGSLNMDLVARVQSLPRGGETLIATGFATDHGGKGANQAVAAARMGAAVAMIGRVGADDHGRQLTQALRDEGIACTHVLEDAERPSGMAMIVVDERSENSIVVIPGANHGPLLGQVQAAQAVIATAVVLVAQLELPLDAVAQALRSARENGVVTLLNAAPAMALPDSLLGLVDWLVVNEGEAAALAQLPVDDVDQAVAAGQALRERGARQVVVTLGAKGLVMVSADGAVQLPATPVKAVDTTGAGDTFVGAMVAALARGLGSAEALRWGQAAAAVAVTRRGAQAAMPRLAELGPLPGLSSS